MSVSQSKIHTYFGMKSDSSILGQAMIAMLDYIQEQLDVCDKAESFGRVQSQIPLQSILLRLTMTVRDSIKPRRSNSIRRVATK